MKRLGIYFWIILVLSLIVVYMLWQYFCQFAGNGWSDDPMEWGAFGSYMSAITGLLAFVGVLASIRNANKKAEKAEKDTEELRKETRIRDERELFFKLIDSHLKSMETLVYTDKKTKERSISLEAFVDYKEELDADLQEIIVFWGASKFESYPAWVKEVTKACYDGFDFVVLVGMYISDQRKAGNEIISEGTEPELSLATDARLKNKFDPELYFYQMNRRLNDFVESKNIEPYYHDFTQNDNIYFKELAYKTWLNLMDEEERFSVLKFVAECYYRKYEASLSYHFNNLCNITYQINDLKTNYDFFMDSWISNLTSLEGVILFFWMLNKKINKEVLRIAKENSLFKNVNLGEFCAYKWDDTINKAVRVTNDYLQMQIDDVPINVFFKSRGAFAESIISD